MGRATRTSRKRGNSTTDSDFSSTAFLKSNTAIPGQEMEQILSMMEKLLHWAAIIESSDDAIISKSIQGYITSWNRGAQALYGYTAEEIVGKPVSVLMPPEREDDFLVIMRSLQAGRKVEHYETKRKTKDGRVIDVSLTVSPIKDMQGNIIGASKIARDISGRKEAEQRRNEFISTVSHELKTPITSQKVFGEYFERLIQKNGDEQYLPYIKKINAQTEKLTKLVNDLLELSRLQAGRFSLERKRIAVDALVDEVIADTENIIKHRLVREGGVRKYVLGDWERLGQVLTNLLSNAVKYSPQAKKVIVSTKVDGQSVVISVQDFGIGIHKSSHEKIFERFFRVTGVDESTYPGMGIGLNFCQEIVTRHGGKIWVESEPGKGSTFYVSLPISTSAKPAPLAKDAS